MIFTGKDGQTYSFTAKEIEVKMMGKNYKKPLCTMCAKEFKEEELEWYKCKSCMKKHIESYKMDMSDCMVNIYKTV